MHSSSRKQAHDKHMHSIPRLQGPYSSVAERQSCKLKVLGSVPSEGSLAGAMEGVRAPVLPGRMFGQSEAPVAVPEATAGILASD